jgi:hypothetical protein
MHFEMFGGAVLVGMMTGWLAGIAAKGGGYGLLWDIIFGLSGSVVGSCIFQTLRAPDAGWGRDKYCRVRRGGPHDHAPAQDLARAGRARLGA